MKYLLILFLLQGCVSIPKDCCHGERIPEGKKCSAGAYIDCEGYGVYQGRAEYCEHWSNCDELIEVKK